MYGVVECVGNEESSCFLIHVYGINCMYTDDFMSCLHHKNCIVKPKIKLSIKNIFCV